MLRRYQTLQPSHTKVRDVMTKHPFCCVPSDTVQQVARLMEEKDVGCLPVVEEHCSRRLVGVITDRDVCCRATADAHDPRKTTLEPYITRKLITCSADDDLERCMELLHRFCIRRVPVVDDTGQCIGIVALSDAPEPAEIVVRKQLIQEIDSTLMKCFKSGKGSAQVGDYSPVPDKPVHSLSFAFREFVADGNFIRQASSPLADVK